MDKVRAFQVGYMKKLAEAGVHPEAAIHMYKQASAGIGALGALWQGIKSTGAGLQSIADKAVYILPGMAGAAGIGTGLLHHKFTDATEEDVKAEELRIKADRLRAEADKIRKRIRSRMSRGV